MGSSMVSYQNLCVVAAWGVLEKGEVFPDLYHTSVQLTGS